MTKTAKTKYTVWNNDHTVSFNTDDYQLAYEVRKGAETNCWSDDISEQTLARKFVDQHGMLDCTMDTNW